jgi:DNA-binding MltR family transcriptional regulator
MTDKEPIDFRWMDEHNRIAAKYADESDRAAALLAASFLEEQLKDALQSVFVDDAEMMQNLFAGYGPLSSFRARIDLAYALGHIPKALHREFHIIRKIRNHFAHHADVTDFSTQRVKDWCLALATPKRLLANKSAELDARTRFLRAVSHCVGDIRMGLQCVPQPTVPSAPNWSRDDDSEIADPD